MWHRLCSGGAERGIALRSQNVVALVIGTKRQQEAALQPYALRVESSSKRGKEFLMDTTRRGMLKTVATAAGAAATHDLAHAQEKVHDQGHSHQAVPSDPALRVKSLESLLVEKGLVDRAALDALIDSYEHKIGPRNGPRGVLHEFGVELGEDVDVRVWDSTAELRYLVLPERPAGTEKLSEEALAALVTRDAMVGVAKVTARREGNPT